MQAVVFVTDDEQAIRTAIVKRLSRQGHRVAGFESGELLIEAVQHDLPDLILLDVKMQGMGGIDTLKRVRQIAPAAMVIMLTAYGGVQDAVEAMKLGAYDFLIKSVDLEVIDPVIARAVDLLTLRRRMESEHAQRDSQYHLSNLQ